MFTINFAPLRRRQKRGNRSFERTYLRKIRTNHCRLLVGSRHNNKLLWFIMRVETKIPQRRCKINMYQGQIWCISIMTGSHTITDLFAILINLFCKSTFATYFNCKRCFIYALIMFSNWDTTVRKIS